MSVYFIRPIGMDGPIKIGCSHSPEGRCAALATWSPFALEVIARIDGNFRTERQFHAMFETTHSRREWFNWSPELQAVVDAINAGTFDVTALPEPMVISRKIDGKPRPSKRWTEAQKLSSSYRARVRKAIKETGFTLADDTSYSDAGMDDPANIARLEEFLSSPAKYGVSHKAIRDERSRQMLDYFIKQARTYQENWLPDEPISIEIARPATLKLVKAA